MTDRAPASKYVLWLLPPPKAQAKFSRLVAELAMVHVTPVFDPHVTLLEGLVGGESELRSSAERLASGLAPFELRLTEADYLPEFYRALFIRAEPSPALLAARRTAEKEFHANSPSGFMPHLSLLYGELEQAEKEEILHRIGRRFDTRFTVYDLALMAIDGPLPKEWRYVARLRLGGQGTAEAR